MKVRGMVLVFGLAALMALALACSNGEAAVTPDTSDTGGSATVVTAPAVPATAPAAAVAPSANNGVSSAGSSGAAVPSPKTAPIVTGLSQGSALGEAAKYAGAPGTLGGSTLLQVAGGSQAGIWVSGEGSITLEPDLAVINIGVETEAISVADARDQASRAMDAITTAVKAQGLVDKDIQTRSFNIFPVYDYSDRKQTLTGYRVSNTASIKIRDLDKVGAIIDDVAAAGGNATRINGISFTVEDTKPFMTELREQAVNDALAKATHLALLTGVSVGQLIYITETGAGGPVVQDFGGVAVERAMAAPAVATSISGGELELRLGVRAVFGIQ